MKKKKTPYLNFYKKCMETGSIPEQFEDDVNGGLCGCFGIDVMDIFTPTSDNCYEYQVSKTGYFGVEVELMKGNNDYDYCLTFGPTRQNMVLLLAAMNNEL